MFAITESSAALALHAKLASTITLLNLHPPLHLLTSLVK
jgi:hypothetical protein